MNLIGQRIQQARGQMSMSELARRVGVSKTTVIRWERGDNVPKADDIKRLAAVLNVAPTHLLGVQRLVSKGGPPEDSFGARLRRMIEEVDPPLSYDAIARAIGVKVGRTVSRLEDLEYAPVRRDQERNARAVADLLGVEYDWLETGEGEPYVLGRPRTYEEIVESHYSNDLVTGDSRSYVSGALVPVPLMSIELSAGPGSEPFTELVERYMAFDRIQVRTEMGVDPSRLIVVKVSGNSMEPTLRSGDSAVVMRHGGEPMIHGAVYAFYNRYLGYMVKRVHFTQQNTYLLKGDNPADGPPHEIDPRNEDCEWIVVGKYMRSIVPL
jgi:phage repressor protein C with HTH and peptisase S24 domain/DNA-binding XRE family transcriptional regulator